MINRIPVLLDNKTTAGLIEMAKLEYRDPAQQAAVLIRAELQRRGFLPKEKISLDCRQDSLTDQEPA